MPKVKLFLLLIAASSLQTTGLGAMPPTDLLLGHFEPHIDYALSPGNPDAGWQFSISYDVSGNFTPGSDGVVRLDSGTTTIVATPETETVLPNRIPGFANAGDTIWQLPQNNQDGKIFLGWRNIIPNGIFQTSINGFFQQSTQGSIIIELINLSGPAADAGGHFAMWETSGIGSVEMHFNSADGIDGNDRLEPVPVGSHTHYNWGLTRPGNYTATFRTSGRLNTWQADGNQDTSGSFDLHFAVPFSSVATGEAELRLSLGSDPTAAAVHPYGEAVEYAPGQVALVTQATTIGGIARPYAFSLDPVADSSVAAPHRVGIPGQVPVAFPTGATLAAASFDVLYTHGPGNLQLLDDGGSRRYFVFSESGIYRVGLRALGNEGGLAGPPFELVFLAGLTADYNFATWADSFERSHGLAPGTLSDDGSDYDGDGVPDVIEYQLFWEGFDPAVADAGKLPRPAPNNPDEFIVFHRDTYKDRLNRNAQNIVLEYSADLSSWLGWSERVSGQPLEQYETGAERGNARARIQRRILRLPANAKPKKGFFRWRIDPAR